MNLQEIESRLTQLDPNNRDHLAEFSRLKTQETELVKQTQAEQEKAALEKNHEERVQTAKDEFATYIQESLAEDGLTPEEIFIGETQQHLYTIKSSQAFNALVSKMSAQINGSEEREIQLRRQNDDLQDKIESTEAQIRQMASDLQEANRRAGQFEFERNEAIKNRDNAAAALEEARTENDRLESQVDDLRKEIAVGARNAYKVVDPVDTAEQIAELVKKVKESRIKVTNMKPVEGDFKRILWQADDAATGETFTFNHLEKGRYLELNQEEVLQFRFEYAQTQALPDISLDHIAAPPIENVVEESQFQEEAGPDVAVPTSSDQETVSREEFETLKGEVEALKRKVGWAA